MIRSIASTRRRAGVLLALAGTLIAAGVQAASAAPAPPTVVLNDGGDGYINAAETGAVVVSGTADPSAVTVSVRIVGDNGSCGSVASPSTANQFVPVTAGAWQATFDLTGFAQGPICARAGAIDGSNVQGPSGTSNSSVLDYTPPPTGTVAIDDGGDGYMNEGEAEHDLPATWTGSGDAATSNLWFENSNGTIPPYDCGVWVRPATGVGELNKNCHDHMPEGDTITFKGRWYDAAGNASGIATDSTIKDTYDPAAGVVSLLDPNGDGYMNIAEASTSCCIPATWTAGSTDAVRATVFFRDSHGYVHEPDCGPFERPPTDVTTGNVNAYCAAAMAQGRFEFVTWWWDVAGNRSAEVSATLIKDTIAPVLTLTSPDDGAFVGSSVTVRGTTDPGNTVTFTVDSLPQGGATVNPDGTFQRTFSLSDGVHTLVATAKDPASNTTSQALTLNVDSLIPVISSPTEGSLWTGFVTLSGTGKPGSKVELFEGTTLVGTAKVSATGNWTTQSGFGTGLHTVRARGVAFGGAPVSPLGPGRSFTVDNGRPSVSIATDDLSFYLPGESLEIQGTAADGSKIDRIEIEYWDSLRGVKHFAQTADCTGCGTPSASWTASPGALPPGLITVQAVAIDDAGNRSNVAAIRILNLSL